MLTLEAPSERLQADFVAMAAEYAESGDPRYLRDASDVPHFFRARLGAPRERPGFVPESIFWLVGGERGDRILGVSRLRHWLTPELTHEGGHIGYDVRPSERRRGHGTTLLRLTLERAAARGVTRVRVTCDAANVASIRVIEKNGGVLAGETISERRGKPIRQYWIDV
jgi:predicted acetyltransferase